MPIENAVKYYDEAAMKIVTHARQDKFQYIAERMLHTPLYNDNEHYERVATVNGRVVAFLSITLDWTTMKSTSCSILAFEETPLTVQLLVKSAYKVYAMGFSEINFAAAEDNHRAVAMWDRIVRRWFVGGRTGETFEVTNHRGTFSMIRWKIFPKRDTIWAS